MPLPPRTSPLVLALVFAATATCRTAPLGPADSSPWRDAPSAATPVARGPKGMVVSVAPLATKVGVEVLRKGGNAVDAAVAVAFALAVVHPAAGNLGGGGFAVVLDTRKQVRALDFREVAPQAARADFYKDRPGASLEGPLSAGVPGSVAGLWELHHEYGIRKWSELLAPAIALARDGFEVDAHLEGSIADAKALLARQPSSAALFLPGGEVPAGGSRWSAPDLAKTLARIAEKGPKDFYSGQTAALVVAEMERGHGAVTAKDLSTYAPVWREPIRFTYRGLTGWSMPPPSSGGIVLALTANLVEPWDLKAMGWHSADAVHVVAESWRRAYAVRNQALGDPDFVKDMPLEKLQSKAFADELRKDVTLDRATPSTAVKGLVEGDHTTHLAVADSYGMVVSLTTTLNLSFGSGVTVTGAGFLLNNEMDDFATQPGQPNAFGLVQGARNAIEPGKRMLSSMSPTIVTDERGAPVMALGAQGGSRIISAVFQVLSNVRDFDFDVGRAVSAPRFHHQHLPDWLSAEAGALSEESWDRLGKKGHVRRLAERLASSPALVRSGGQWTGAADPREGGLALGE